MYGNNNNLMIYFIFLGLRILNFPCNQFAGQMPEADGDAMVCHLKGANHDIGEIFAKVHLSFSYECTFKRKCKFIQ